MNKRKKEEDNENNNNEQPGNENSNDGEAPNKDTNESEALPSLTISYAELEGLNKQIADLQAKSEDYLSGLQRERADFANYKRRIDQENQNTYQFALAELVKPFLVIIDDLERALKHAPNDKDLKSWIDGITLILQKLVQTLEKQGIERIEVKPGEEFDPMRFEAVTHEESPDFENGQIIEVIQTGYKIKERIIRPALVRVAK